jgi:hypothetical protein
LNRVVSSPCTWLSRQNRHGPVFLFQLLRHGGARVGREPLGERILVALSKVTKRRGRGESDVRSVLQGGAGMKREEEEGEEGEERETRDGTDTNTPGPARTKAPGSWLCQQNGWRCFPLIGLGIAAAGGRKRLQVEVVLVWLVHICHIYIQQHKIYIPPSTYNTTREKEKSLVALITFHNVRDRT